LNLLQLAPGGHVGRFVIFTEGAFAELNKVFGTQTKASQQKKGHTLPYAEVTNPDISRVINSNEIQSALRNAKTDRVLHDTQKKNPLNNSKALVKVLPNSKLTRQTATRVNE
jgi:large subunit ribosomal protein L4e